MGVRLTHSQPRGVGGSYQCEAHSQVSSGAKPTHRQARGVLVEVMSVKLTHGQARGVGGSCVRLTHR